MYNTNLESKNKIGIIINFLFIMPPPILIVYLKFYLFLGIKQTKVLGQFMNIIEVLFLNLYYPSNIITSSSL